MRRPESAPVGLQRTSLVRALLAALLLASGAALADDPLPEPVARILAHYGIPSEAYSVWAQDIALNVPLLSHRAGVSRPPASVIKVLTGWLALEELGPEYRWVTRAYLGGALDDGVLTGPLLLQGGGDPRLVVERLWLMQREMRERGLREIRGGLVIDDRWLPAMDRPVEGFAADRHRSFSAAPYALLMNFQSVRIVIEPEPARNRVKTRLDPALSGLEIVNRIRLAEGACGGFQRGVSVRIGGEADNRVELGGAYSRRCNSWSIPRRALSSPAYAFGLFDAMWREAGGELSGGYRLGVVPEDAEPWLEFKSEFASQAVRYMNKYSNNVMARQLLLTLGAETFGAPATLDKAHRAVGEILRGAGLELPSLVLDNGSGLSRIARISAQDLGRVLVHAARGPRYPELAASLPIAGRDGTLTRTYRESNFSGSARIKTGSLNGVSAIAGLVFTGAGKRLAVVALMEHPLAAKGPGEEAHGALLTILHGH